MKKLTTFALSALLSSTASLADTTPGNWVGYDVLGRRVADVDHPDGGRTSVDNSVEIGMFYYLWHGYHGDKNPICDNTLILRASTSNPQWGPYHKYHWHSEPILGYYDGWDEGVMSRHLQMLCDAGVNFIVFDCTNGPTYYGSIKNFINCIRHREAHGLRVPKLACMLHSAQEAAMGELWDNLYSHPEYDDVWYRINGKPLLLCDTGASFGSRSNVLVNFTTRYCWAWTGGSGSGRWSWLDNYPQPVSYGPNGNECISVSTAQHAHSNIGKSFHNGSQPAVNAEGLCTSTNYGYYHQEQWNRALSLSDASRPGRVFITQWNEWIGMRFHSNGAEGDAAGYYRPGGPRNSNECYFIDIYNAEYNRDIEPSTHGQVWDNYYLQMLSNIRKYRGMPAMTRPTRNVTIRIDGDWSQWDYVPESFTDDEGDNEFYAPSTFNKTPANDIVETKVTQDKNFLYFYVRTKDDIVWRADNKNLRLLLKIVDGANGWHGWNFYVAREGSQQPHLYFYGSDGQFDKGNAWTHVGPLDYKTEGNKYMFRIPKFAVVVGGYQDIEFKWVDHVWDCDPIYYYANGDVAPNGRLGYRYKGSAVTTDYGEAPDPYTDPDGTAIDDNISYKKTWTSCLADNNVKSWMDFSGTPMRHIAQHGGKLYVLSANTSAFNIQIINAYTGEKIGDLSTRGVSGGLFALSGIAADTDGNIYASNVTISAANRRIYRWTSDTADPEVVLDVANTQEDGAYVQTGATLSLPNGDPHGSLFLVNGNSSKVYEYDIRTDGTVNPTPKTISLKQSDGSAWIGGGSRGSSEVAFDPDDGCIWVSAKDKYPTRFASDGGYLGEIKPAVLGSNMRGTSMHPFHFGNKKYAVATFYGEGQTDQRIIGARAALINCTNSALPDVTAANQHLALLGDATAKNTSFITDILTDKHDSGRIADLWQCVPGQGIAYYRHVGATSGIDDISREPRAESQEFVDENAPVEYYNMAGARVQNPTPGIYIRRQGNSTSKVVIR